MKKIFLGLLAAGMIGFAFTPTAEKEIDRTELNTTVADENLKQGIKFFKGTWKEALAKAKAENKLIFLDAYASWCGPCKRMAATTFKDKEVGEFFNERFINFKMDMEKHKQGRRLSSKYRLTAYPTLYFIDGNENVAHKSVGGLNTRQAIDFAKQATEN